MPETKPAVVVTGAAGNLGVRLLPLLDDFTVIAVDVIAPPSYCDAYYEQLDLSEPSSGTKLLELLHRTHAKAVVHLAFIIDPTRMGVLDVDRMWQINVAGTGRVVDAIAEANRGGEHITKFIYPSSVSAYGPELPPNVTEDHPLLAHTLPYAIHKQEAEKLLQEKASAMGECRTYVLRPHIYAGASMQNYLVGALRGTPTGRGPLGKWLRKHNVRLPLVLPAGRQYREKRFQFVHVDDVARLIACILQHTDKGRDTIVLNVPGKGPAVTLEEAARIAKAVVIPLPSPAFCRWILQMMWRLGISDIPPEALPYMIGSYTMDAHRLRAYLGSEYEQVMQYTVEQALQDSFRPAENAHRVEMRHVTSPP